MMNSREIVLKAVCFESPPRVPIFWSGEGRMSDVVGVAFKFGGGWVSANARPRFWEPKVEGEDEWHCVWRRPSTGRTMGQVKAHPMCDWEKLEEYQFPETRVEERFEGVEKVIKEAHARGKFVMGTLGLGFWEVYRGVRGTVAALCDLFVSRGKMERLIDRIVDFGTEMIKEYGDLEADGVSWADDWGTQKSGMVSPKMWRDIFKPRYRRWTEAAKKGGMQTFFHSCGCVYDYISDMIDVGVDMLNLNQPELLGIDNLGRDFGGKVCFVTNVDLQKTLARGIPEDIAKEVKHLISALGCFDGGLILEGWNSDILVTDGTGWDSGGYLRNYSTECADTMYKAYVEYGKYPRKISQHACDCRLSQLARGGSSRLHLQTEDESS